MTTNASVAESFSNMLPWLDPGCPLDSFPDTSLALTEPNGLLAAGADLSVERLVTAYCAGIFPWFNDDEPILWWSPSPRSILLPDQLKISRSLKKNLRQADLSVTTDQAFDQVIKACAAPRADQPGTWILPVMQQAYQALHQAGYAHSVEVWYQEKLVGGLYGVGVGNAFFGESMFTLKSNASKIALVHLMHYRHALGLEFIDCQMQTTHLDSLGAANLPRDLFEARLAHAVSASWQPQTWNYSHQNNLDGPIV